MIREPGVNCPAPHRSRGSLFEDQQPATNIDIPADPSSARMPTSIDLPPLNGTTFRSIICQCHNQRRAFHATRKERTGHPQAARVEVELGRGKTDAEAVRKIGVTAQNLTEDLAPFMGAGQRVC